MEFNSAEFLNIFLPLTLILCRLMPLWTGYILLFFSMIFYGWNSSIGLILLIFSIFIVHLFRKYFKFNYQFKILASLIIISPFLFFRSSSILINLYPSLANLQKLYPESFILPAGVSFYTFQLIGYLFDNKPDSKKIKFKHSLLFILFFPQLIAGPIERGKDLIPQIKSIFSKKFRIKEKNVKDGTYLLAIGLFMKTFFSDILAASYEDFYTKGSLGAFLQMLANGSVIYFDFLGYSLIAIGLAKFFNVELTLNFIRPYASTNVAEFWRRWHITLTSWFKDYLYKPIALNFNFSKVSLFASSALVFLFTSLWHGFGLRFLIWGFGHFILVIISRTKNSFKDNLIIKYVSWISTFLAVNFLWIFFFYGKENYLLFIKNLFSFISLEEIIFNKRSFLLPISIIFSILLDPARIISYEILENKKINFKDEILGKQSRFFTKIFYRYTNKFLLSILLIFTSIAFFSYSKTFVYFRF